LRNQPKIRVIASGIWPESQNSRNHKEGPSKLSKTGAITKNHQKQKQYILTK